MFRNTLKLKCFISSFLTDIYIFMIFYLILNESGWLIQNEMKNHENWPSVTNNWRNFFFFFFKAKGPNKVFFSRIELFFILFFFLFSHNDISNMVVPLWLYVPKLIQFDWSRQKHCHDKSTNCFSIHIFSQAVLMFAECSWHFACLICDSVLRN